MLLRDYLPKIIKTTSLFLILFFFLFNISNAQDKKNEETKKPETTEKKVIAINDISTESEKLSQRIFKLQEILKPSSEINNLDSLMDNTTLEINRKKDSLYSKIDNMSQRRLRAITVEWQGYKTELKEYQNVLNKRLKDVTEINKEMLNEIAVWENTKEDLNSNNNIKDVYSNIDTIISKLNEVAQLSLIRLDTMFIIQKKLTNLILTTDEVISEIKRAQHQLQKDYFVFDNPALWQFSKIDSIAKDTSNLVSINSLEAIKTKFDDNMGSLKEFYDQNKGTVISQILFMFLIFMLLIVVKKRWHINPNNKITQVEKETIIILRHPIAVTLVIGILVSAFFYDSLIPTVAEILIIIIMSATAFLLPRLSTKQFGIFLQLLLLVFFVKLFTVYLSPQSFLFRIILIINTVILVFALHRGRKEIKSKPDSFVHLKGLFNFSAPVFGFFLVIAFVANIIGMVHLSRFLVTGVLSSVSLGTIVYLSVKIITSIFILLIQLLKSDNALVFSTIVKVAQKRIKPTLFFFGLIMWLMFTLKSFELYEHLIDNINELLTIKWEVGNITISLGGILSFSIIFLIAILLAKLAAAIFQDDWLIKLLPRGVAPAISLMLRIFIITLGFYAALTAAKVPLEQLGFIVGALGVGIGFGLQNVVLNFVAGLILAFERPINLGDTIEVDMEKGVVTSIGVRSSNIRTYTGSEVIIPNGDLISKKVVNWTLTNRDRRSKILMKTAIIADPGEVIEMFNRIANEHPNVYKNPAPWTHFYGFNLEGNLDFALHYWTSFDNTLSTDNDIALKIYKELKEKGIQAPIPTRKIISERRE